jgi:plasmid stability protein
MKNVTIALDDDTHRRARIRAAELGTSLSSLVKSYLTGLADGGVAPEPLFQPEDVMQGVREMPMPFHHAPPSPTAYSPAPGEKGPDGQPYFVNGKWVFTKDGKPRKPGALRHLAGWTDDFDEWPDGVIKSLEAWRYDDPDFDPLPFDDSQLPKQ